MNSGNGMTAQKLRLILLICMVVLLGAGVGGFMYISGQLRIYTRQVNTLEARAGTSNDDLVKLQVLKRSLSQNTAIIEKTHGIVSDSKSYRYQDEIVKDLTKYASQSGISILGFIFGTTATTNGSSSTSEGTTQPSTTTPSTSSTLPGGIKSVSVTVSIDSPTNYSKFMKFVQLIETNATKMQIKSISAAKATGTTDKNAIEPQDLQIEVYVR